MLKMRKVLSVVLAAVLLISLLPTSAMALRDGNRSPGTREYGDYAFTKVSNPGSGPGTSDGINTNDSTGYGANRFNSYAWAVASRGDYIYVGTNRALFGSALNAVGETLRQQNPDLTAEKLNALVSFLSGGDVPVNLSEEDYIPQIIRFDVKNGATEVIYRPATVYGADGALYYTDRDGNIVPNADVASEAASFRSVIEFQGNLYFGSLGTNMLQMVRIDGKDRAEVVFQTIGLISSLRACCVYGEGEEETVYSGGQDTTYGPWRAYRQANPESGVMPIVIRYLDPRTAGSDNEDWSGLVADFRDFGQYAGAKVYMNGGGNVWDLCSYNGKLYVILAYDRGWAMFRGEPGGQSPNQFGWTWTEIVGDNGKYPLAMDKTIGVLNERFQEDYGCAEYAPNLNGAGLLESTATPYVYDGKMYIGTFDNATCIQSQTMIKLLVKLSALLTSQETGDTGPSLSQIYAPIFEVLSHPQRVWVMDENESINAVESANALLSGTTNDYVWRFAELDGKLYAGTFDSATAYSPYLNLGSIKMQEALKIVGLGVDDFLAKLDGSNIGRLQNLIDGLPLEEMDLDDMGKELLETAGLACELFYKVFQDRASVEDLLNTMEGLKTRFPLYVSKNPDALPEEAVELISWLLNAVDLEGLHYWAKARALANNEQSGFDFLVTEDGESWERIVSDGLGDAYNYGARTLTVHQGDLYVGTANPYYGAQLWKMTDTSAPPLPETMEMTEGDVVPGFTSGSKATSDDPSVAWVDSDGCLKALKEGSTVIRVGEETCKVTVSDYEDGSEVVGQLKILARFNDSMQFYDGHVYLLFTSYKDDVTIKVDDLYAGYEISDLYYEDIGKDISYGSNHNKGTTPDDYFTFREGMTSGDGMNSVTLDRGEIVTIGMYRDFDLTVPQAAMGSVQNSTLWTSLTEAAKTEVVEALFAFLDSWNIPSVSGLTDLLKETVGEDADYMKLLDGVVGGGVCFNRELYNQKLEWDQYENVTYELDITQDQLDTMVAALQGNLNHFSIMKNSCATVALRAWNAAVGIRDGEDTAYKLEPTGTGVFALIDAPKTVKDEIVQKLPGYYLNNAQGVAEPNAGFIDDTGWVYVSAPEALPGGGGTDTDNRLVISVTGSAQAETRVYYLNDEGREISLPLSQSQGLPKGTKLYISSALDPSESEYLLSDITMNGVSLLGNYDPAQDVYTATVPEGNSRLTIAFEKAVVHAKKPNQIQVASGDTLSVTDCACLSVGDRQTEEVVWKVIDGPVSVSSDGKTLTAGKPGTAVVWAGAAGNENIGVPFTIEILDSLADMVSVTFNEDARYTLTADGTPVPCSGYLVEKGSVLTITLEQKDPEVVSLITANRLPVVPGNTITVTRDTDIQVNFRAAEIKNMPATIRLNETGETYSLEPSIKYSEPVASLLPVYDPTITFACESELISVDENGMITVNGEIPEDGAVAIVNAVAGSSNHKVIGTTKVVLGDYQAERPVGRLTVSARYIHPGEMVAHGCVTFVTYEDVDLNVSYYNYYEPTQAYHDLMEDYRDHPEKYGSDPALYNESMQIEDRESYFITHSHGAGAEPETIHLRAGEGLTFANYGFDSSNLVALRKALESEKLTSSQEVQALIEQLRLYSDGEKIDGPLAFDSLLASLIQIYAITNATGQNPADGRSEGGLNVNREVFNQFRRSDSQMPNNYYTIEVTAEQLEYFKSYLADPRNNCYSLFTKNCGTGLADIWNTTLFDRPDLELTGNYTGFATEPESLSIELLMLKQKTGLEFNGTGEGGGTDFYPRISPAWYRDVTIAPDDQSKRVGEADPQLTATIEGLPEGRTLNYTLVRAPGEVVGTYAIKVELGDNPGYRITTEEGTFTISAKEIILPTVSVASWYYGDKPNVPVLGEGSNPGNGEVTYAYKAKSAEDSAYTETVPTEIGNYTVKATIAETDDYSGGTATADFSIRSRSSGGGGGGGGGGGAVPAVNPVNLPPAASDAVNHGQVTSSTPSARTGEKVTLTLNPDEGYQAAGVTVTDKNGKDVPVTKNPDGTYSFTMPSAAVNVLPAFTKIEEPTDDAECPKDASCPISRFTDAKSTDWYHDGVHWALDEGLMKGIAPTLFAPNDNTTRAMVVTMLWRLEGEKDGKLSPFTDVKAGSWYESAVNWAAETGVVNGTSETTFSPDDSVTREQLAAMLYRYAQTKGEGFTGTWAFPLSFPDAADVSDFAYEPLCWMTMQGVIQGMDDGTLAPKDCATRAQIATMFMRFVDTTA